MKKFKMYNYFINSDKKSEEKYKENPYTIIEYDIDHINDLLGQERMEGFKTMKSFSCFYIKEKNMA